MGSDIAENQWEKLYFQYRIRRHSSIHFLSPLAILSGRLPCSYYLDKIMLAIINAILHPLINSKSDFPRILMIAYSVFRMHYIFVIICITVRAFAI
jgi:hypothetical protein